MTQIHFQWTVIYLYFHDQYPHPPHDERQQPSVQYIPPTVIERYVNQWIRTSIPGYGQVIAYVLDYNNRTGMVSMFMYAPPRYRRQYIQVHYSDLVGIQPYFGPTPPRPGGGQPQPPRPPRPPRPRPRPPYYYGPGSDYGPGGPGGPGGPSGGGGVLPWLMHHLF
ncbi:hypothetical protein [Alteribacillus iranensis]|uniref:Uncharacterized protein n=1 Tax=Alteribacillus iranensis TaxID=930128 RepID=A0A1I2D1R6_9BACI|nr:hypothetical protein [Alteribacillus iranensis]SFE74462.1 hypothetical protein SAMN05192532_103345 [Alteribacillus iranensis]